ncbi:ABC transporter ATP-binding protein [Plantibacter sp. Mn2098]|uniref:ABC transporter ATP-binding protein n=1 Tax=Plantibacter sp. Mn2098 TaxID=3395266 RepID=UPI003BD6EDED
MEVAAEQVIVNRGGRPVLAGVTVRAHAGQSLALVGPSGSGKTTLLNVLGLLQRTDGGHVKIDGQDATRWTDGQRRRFWQQHATFVFQDYGLIDDHSVAYNVVLARLPLLGLRAADVRAVDAVLERVGLCGRAREQVSSLSGGEKQRVGLARAMYRQADVIFADEPTASLDRVNRDHVTGFLHGEAARGATVVIATHDDALMRACDTRIDLVAPAV